ncbi:hydrolase [Corynebacterium lizhenjunii]|uniref:Hydrolase n=1 Tax=Corynebacterium lizhenjunii TaxID=2709394 RepID=A0A7T0PAR4_9CORY|nr:GDSL-type esterase/lipase family protein [Corynebacterium lizhenjunii]QPK79366.1 hydrolase [Corynebacterium lizhenjunii]
MRLRIKSATAVVAACMAATSLFAPATALAQERNLVAFGDSVLANPNGNDYLSSRLGPEASSVRNGLGCPQSNNYARRAGAMMGMPVRDFSCSGTVTMSHGPHMRAQIDDAIRTGALTPATARVVYTVGFNDTYNNPRLNMQQIREQWVRANVPLIQLIRNAAPNARIQIVGYPTIGDNGNYCLFNLGGSSSQAPIPLPQVQDWENKAQWMQVDLARATGVEFLDLKPATRHNGMCASDSQRMWSGLVDFGAGTQYLPLHINERGQQYVAGIVARS